MHPPHRDWLLEGDPAIAWQSMRDLAGTSPAEIARMRARVPHEGLGAAILARQRPEGGWHVDGKPAWLPTLFTALLLRATGADPADPLVAAAVERLATGFRWDAEFGAKPFFEGEVEPCINGGTLAVGSFFGRPEAALARRLVSEQLDDGGWNCDAPKSRRGSFHTTICVLEGLLEYERAVGPSPEVSAARARGHEYLLERALFRRRSTGEVVSSAFFELAFPPRYHYDVLRGLDYLRAAGVAPEGRMDEAARWLEARGEDARWRLDRAFDEAIEVPVGERVGDPSRWNTLRALRVLRWYRG